jgi:hypothetical protein
VESERAVSNPLSLHSLAEPRICTPRSPQEIEVVCWRDARRDRRGALRAAQAVFANGGANQVRRRLQGSHRRLLPGTDFGQHFLRQIFHIVLMAGQMIRAPSPGLSLLQRSTHCNFLRLHPYEKKTRSPKGSGLFQRPADQRSCKTAESNRVGRCSVIYCHCTGTFQNSNYFY